MKLVPQTALEAPFASVARLATGAVVLSERADIGCVLLNATTDPARFYDPAGVLTGVELPRAPGAVGRSGHRQAIWLTPRSWLVLCELEAEEVLVTRINAAFTDKSLHAAHFADYLCWLELSGPRSHAVLRDSSFISLDRAGLSLHHAKRTLVAGIAAIVVSTGVDAYLIGVERSRARYFADRILDMTRTGMSQSS